MGLGSAAFEIRPTTHLFYRTQEVTCPSPVGLAVSGLVGVIVVSQNVWGSRMLLVGVGIVILAGWFTLGVAAIVWIAG